MSLLLTGATGYIGSHVAIELINAGYDIIIVDNFNNSNPSVLDRMERITGRHILCYGIEVANADALEHVFATYDINAVLHFAGYKAVGESVHKPVAYYRNNLDTTLTLLEAMAKHKVKKLVFSSSATVYDENAAVPYTEDTPAGNCTSPYGRTKYFIEQILTDAAHADPEMSVVLLRYFNPIGAHESGLIGELPNGIPNNLFPYITQTAAGIRKILNVFGNDYATPDGTGIRDYIHVVDLAKGHVAALKYADAFNGVEIFNLGTGKGTSVLEIIQTFEKTNGVAVPYRFVARRPGDIAACYASTEKAERVLNWKAEKTIEDMCRDSWRWQQYCLSNGICGSK